MPLDVAERWLGAPDHLTRVERARGGLSFHCAHASRPGFDTGLFKRCMAAAEAFAADGTCDLSGLPHSAVHLAKALRGRRLSLYRGLQDGVLQAYGQHRAAPGVWQPIAPSECGDAGVPVDYKDPHVTGANALLFFEQAVFVFTDARRRRDLEQLASAGAVYSQWLPDQPAAKRFHALHREAQRDLAAQVALGTLVASAPRENFGLDPWTGDSSIAWIPSCRFRLPTPDECGGAADQTIPAAGKRPGRPPRIDWMPAKRAAWLWLAEQRDLAAAGLRAKLMAVMERAMTGDDGEPGAGETAIGERASALIAAEQRIRAGKVGN